VQHPRRAPPVQQRSWRCRTLTLSSLVRPVDCPKVPTAGPIGIATGASSRSPRLTDAGRGQSSSRSRVRSMSALILASTSFMIADSEVSWAMASFFLRFAAAQS